MNFRRMALASTVALVVSGTCTYALGRRMNGQRELVAVELKYVAPAKNLLPGEILKPENLVLVDWPAANPVPGAFAGPADLMGRAVLYPMYQGQPITDKFLTAVGAGTGLSGRIPDGMRAIALRSDEVVGVAGFLLPGSHVDVIGTFRMDKYPEPTTMTILQDAEVLAAGHQIEPDPEGKPATVTVVTLLLTPSDAERAVLASSQATIHFVLRSGSDKVRIHDAPIPLSQLAENAPTTRAAVAVHPVHVYRAPAEQHFPVNPITIETITGDKQTTDTFSGTAPQ
jgi:pilus assembly protein CpaB